MADQPAPRRSDFKFFETMRVRWADVDLQAIVFNPNYLVYADTAMTEYLRAIGFGYPQGLHPYGVDLFAVSSTVDFKASAKFDDVLDLGVRVERIGRSSLRFRISMFRGDALVADVRTTYVCATPGENRASVAAPAPFVAAIEAFEVVKPERA